jgi:predicted RNA-binding Zn ribbon-like protein
MSNEEVPELLQLVESFGNSIDVGVPADDLDTPQRFGRWLDDHGFPGIAPTAAELEFARGVRAALRDELLAHHDDLGESARGRLDQYAARIPMRATFGPEPATFVPVGDGVPAMLGQVLAAMVIADREGSWDRLKICREDTCLAVFYDRTKNQSRTWCSMGCGNRNKTRSYRDRRRIVGPAEA